MEGMIDFSDTTFWMVMNILLFDYTAERNIIWATNPPPEAGCGPMDEITMEQLEKIPLVPRARKKPDEQKNRTKEKGEVFTPLWVVSKMADHAERELNKGNLEQFVFAKCLEVTCGEAPFLTSRYDPVTGEPVAISDRVGILDRKLKAIRKNETDPSKQKTLMIGAYGSIYGYEYQGDSLLLARANLYLTFTENWTEMFGSPPDIGYAALIAQIISQNVLQMDGLKKTVPGTDIPCKVYDWKKNEEVLFRDIGKETDEK